MPIMHPDSTRICPDDLTCLDEIIECQASDHPASHVGGSSPSSSPSAQGSSGGRQKKWYTWRGEEIGKASRRYPFWLEGFRLQKIQSQRKERMYRVLRRQVCTDYGVPSQWQDCAWILDFSFSFCFFASKIFPPCKLFFFDCPNNFKGRGLNLSLAAVG
ncbi:hypothetical protein P175DRAFT_0141823 [Aspergillus ochraceoroseus IBT 24754]|uniref:Uncharacterized protein n=1 Tax=Aspergillus ochraceoroseus IBT 24754 TaxID=1392256 RepID=A0A2T5M2C1_9EURO|nr:uncharacterized protein P175DRAFT_0141823 [Aspergillus ochraceoroseus IBT 24754]PTU22685.1 hypothetical protein P175DRAFT_0141823 [Aspergillus ochraceoroseus IBT 24754]